jgi:peptide/nickel transport system permease protein
MYTPGSTATGIPMLLDVLYHMFLPFVVLTLSSVAGIMRYMRSSMLEVIRQDYIRTARAKGLKEKVVIYKHALKNALIPVITLLGFWLPGLFSGAIVTEQIFCWPGIGPVQLIATNGRDYPLLMGITMLLAVLTLLGNLIADVSYAIVDPRIRLK